MQVLFPCFCAFACHQESFLNGKGNVCPNLVATSHFSSTTEYTQGTTNLQDSSDHLQVGVVTPLLTIQSVLLLWTKGPAEEGITCLHLNGHCDPPRARNKFIRLSAWPKTTFGCSSEDSFLLVRAYLDEIGDFSISRLLTQDGDD